MKKMQNTKEKANKIIFSHVREVEASVLCNFPQNFIFNFNKKLEIKPPKFAINSAHFFLRMPQIIQEPLL